MNPLFVSFDNHTLGWVKKFHDHFNKSNLTDVTLVTDDHVKIEAHKLVLCSGSKVFEKFLLNNPHPHPMMFMRGIKEQEMKCLLEFLYKGETQISQDIISNFMKMSQDLEISGLHNENMTEGKSSDRAIHQNRALTKDLNVSEKILSRKDSDINFEANSDKSSEDNNMDVPVMQPIKLHNEDQIEGMLNKNVSVERISLIKSLVLTEKTIVEDTAKKKENCDISPINVNENVEESIFQQQSIKTDKVILNDAEGGEAEVYSVIDDADSGIQFQNNLKVQINEDFELEEIDLSNDDTENISQLYDSEPKSDTDTMQQPDLDFSQPSKSRKSKAFKSPIWNWFILDPEDHTNAICQVAGCPYPTVSRGRMRKAGKQGLTTSVIRNHLKKRHGKIL